MTGRTRYGDLLRDASHHLLRGTVILTRDRFDDTAAAHAAIAARQDLLHGLGRGSCSAPTCACQGRACPPSATPAGRPACGSSTSLPRSVVSEAGRPVRHRVAWAAAWGAAGTAVRTASDMLATHRDAAGRWRNPHAALLDDPTVRAIALAEVATLVVPLAETTEQLGLRSGQAGVPWSQVQRLLPPVGALARLAAQVRTAAGAPTGRRGAGPRGGRANNATR